MKFLLAAALVTFGVTAVPALAQQTAMDRCLDVYSLAECERLQNTYADEPEQPIYVGRVSYTHLMPSCEPEANPPEGWLRPNGFCALTDQTQKKSLLYTGADYWFGFKGK